MRPMAKKFGIVSVIFISVIVSILLLFFFTYVFMSQRDTWCRATSESMMMEKSMTPGMPMAVPEAMKE
jgi:uncharacterized protein YacL